MKYSYKIPDGYYTISQICKVLNVTNYDFLCIFNQNKEELDFQKIYNRVVVYAIKDIPFYNNLIRLEFEDIKVFNRIESYKLNDDQYKVLLKECNECPTSEEILNKEQLINKINKQ